MRKIVFFFLLIALIAAAGCSGPEEIPEKPIGKGSMDLCITDPGEAHYWQKNRVPLWSAPENPGAGKSRAVIVDLPACDNLSLTVWEYQQEGCGWYRITARTADGKSANGWLPAGRIMQFRNETGTEWSRNYSAITGLWNRAGQGNGARIWYDFAPGGTYTFNYDMRGNRDPVQDAGSWTYLGNATYELVSDVTADHGHSYVTLDPNGRSFRSGTVFLSMVNMSGGAPSPGLDTERRFDPPVEQEIVYIKV